MSSLERTGWRDASLSQRHRLYGSDCPAVDADFIPSGNSLEMPEDGLQMAEFDHCRPCALIEYKHLGARLPDYLDPNIRTLRYLADSARIPMFLTFYDSRTWTFKVYPYSDRAAAIVPAPRVTSERGYVGFLYYLRNRRIPPEIASKLNTTIEWQGE